MRFKSLSSCVCEVVLGNANFDKTASASARSFASSTGIRPTEIIEDSNKLASTQAYNIAFDRAMTILNLQNVNKKDIFLKDETSKLTNNCYIYIYTNPTKVICKKSFTLNYISPNIDINHTFNLTFNKKIISTFVPNIILTTISSGSPTSYLSNVTINRNTGECFVSSNIVPNKIYTVNKTTGEYQVYLETLDSGLQEPVGIEFDTYNNLFLANFLKSDIKVYNSSKKLIYTINDSLFQNLGGLGFYKGVLYALNGVPVSNDQYNNAFIMFKILLMYDSKNNIIGHDISVFCTNTLVSPLFMCFDNFDNCYVTNYFNNTISKINMTTAEAVVYIDSSSGLVGPRGIAIDKEFNLFVSCGDVSTATYFIVTINKQKMVSTYTTRNLNSPRGIAIDIDGDQSLYICNVGSTLVKIIRDKYLFNVEKNSLKSGDNKLAIKDTNDNTTIDNVVVEVIC